MLDGIQRVKKGSAPQVYQAPGSRLPPFAPEFSEPVLIPIGSVHSRRKSLFLKFHPTSRSRPISMWRDLLISQVFIPFSGLDLVPAYSFSLFPRVQLKIFHQEGFPVEIGCVEMS